MMIGFRTATAPRSYIGCERPDTARPSSDQLRSETAIVAGIAQATLGARSSVDWERLAGHYDLIRDGIERVFPIFGGYNGRIRVPGGVHLTSPARERIWATPSAKAEFFVYDGVDADSHGDDPTALWLTTIRSHDQVELETISTDGVQRRVDGFKVVPYSLPDGCCGAYYPETNPLAPLYACDPQSHTPSYKAIPIRIHRSTGATVPIMIAGRR